MGMQVGATGGSSVATTEHVHGLEEERARLAGEYEWAHPTGSPVVQRLVGVGVGAAAFTAAALPLLGSLHGGGSFSDAVGLGGALLLGGIAGAGAGFAAATAAELLGRPS
ncbi:MAG: hypothetical protein JWM98_2548, partial [Thermoleophilia bacterium]|nr:hypothetical protein [Thermoleophilia bacterium]